MSYFPAGRRMAHLVWVATLASMAALIGSALVLVLHASASHTTVPPGDGRQFVWPVTSWVAANHEYASGSHHSGSADLAAHLGSPVRPARAGTVIEKTYTQADGWRVRIEHEAAGDNYISSYSHLMAEPEVQVGQQVSLDTVIGRLGRVGNADASGPHVHFFLARGNTSNRLRIPELEIGEWVDAGAHIPGIYSGLDPITSWSPPLDVVVSEPNGVRVYATTQRRAADIIAELPAGSLVSVVETSRGQYRVNAAGTLGWIPSSGTRPAGTNLSGLRITSSNFSYVRDAPSGWLIGTAAAGSHLTVYATQDGWRQVLWPCTQSTNRSDSTADVSRDTGGCPGLSSGLTRWKYGWVGPSVSVTTSAFPSRTRIANLNVYANRVVGGESQPDTSQSMGRLAIGQRVHVVDTRNGWYRIEFGSSTGWIRGWYTAGRQ